MAWPCHETLWGPGGLERARRSYAEVARAIAEFEPVTMIARADLLTDARHALGDIEGIELLAMAQDDSWLRDTGPTFVHSQEGRVAGIDWRFNGWGGVHGHWQADAAMAAAILEQQGLDRIPSRLTTEGGSIHTDGKGTFLLSETAILDPERNAGWSKADVEQELARVAGAKACCWLAGGLRDDETRGHIDNIACFSAAGRILTLDPNAAAPHDRPMLVDNLERLTAFRDATGQPFEVELLPLPQPRVRHDGTLMTRTYINFYIANGGIVLPSFDDPADVTAAAIIRRHFPDRRCVSVAANAILEGGGGIHCITQQQPIAIQPS